MIFVSKPWAQVWLTTALTLVAGHFSADANAQPGGAHIRIVVIKTREIPFYLPAVEGLVQGLKSKGYRLRERLDLKVVALGGKLETDRALIDSQIATRPNLIVTLGSDATRLTADQKPPMPVLFGMVLDPVRLGVVKSIEVPGGDFTGITIPVSPGKQMDMLLQAAPSVRSIGVLYTDQDPTSLAFLADATEDARRLHVDIVAMPVAPLQSARDALKKFRTIPDALWLLPDPASSAPLALKETLEFAQAHRLPLLGTSDATVRAGALLALAAGLEDQGYCISEMAARILDGTDTPAHMRVRGPRRTVLTLNLVTFRKLGIAIPKEVLHLADEVIDGDQEDK